MTSTAEIPLFKGLTKGNNARQLFKNAQPTARCPGFTDTEKRAGFCLAEHQLRVGSGLQPCGCAGAQAFGRIGRRKNLLKEIAFVRQITHFATSPGTGRAPSPGGAQRPFPSFRLTPPSPWPNAFPNSARRAPASKTPAAHPGFR